ncbi:MAG: hypothetical protein ISR77_09040 [Pirellulaceae bacterium]|nr:hypothetical protein [Pirellulaceae bacterium]
MNTHMKAQMKRHLLTGISLILSVGHPLLMAEQAPIPWVADNGEMRLHDAPHGEKMAGGLGWTLFVTDDGFRLGKRAHVCFPEWYFRSWVWCGAEPCADRLDLGLFRPSGLTATTGKFEATWAGMIFNESYREDGEPRFFKAHVSRLSPAVLLEFDARSINLFEKARVGGYAKLDPKHKHANQEPWAGDWPGSLLPKHLVVGGERGCKIVPRARLPFRLSPDDRWILCWYGDASRLRADAAPGHMTIRTDCPVLIAFSHPPVSIQAEEDHLRLDYEDPGPKSLAVLPLLGERLPRAVAGEKPRRFPAHVGFPRGSHGYRFAELPATEDWTAQLPPRVLAMCRQWYRRLGHFPIEVTETFHYLPETDESVIAGEIRFVKVHEHGVRFAPLPPMLAMAAHKEFSALSLSAQPVDTGLVSKWGPYSGYVDSSSYRVSIKGLNRYVLQRRRTLPEAKEPATVRKAFDEEVEKVVRAGILSPWHAIVCMNAAGQANYMHCWGNDTRRQAWGNPAENLYYITQCLDIASPDLNRELLELAKAWQKKYPAEKNCHMPYGKDAPREHYRNRIGAALPSRSLNFHFIHNVIPVESLYFLAEYYHALGEAPPAFPRIIEPYARRSDWASLGFRRAPKLFKARERPSALTAPYSEGLHFDVMDKEVGRGGVDDLNRFFAGAIGHVRLARLLGDGEQERIGRYYLARSAVLRYAMECWKEYLYEKDFIGLPEPPENPRVFHGEGLLHVFERRSPHDDALCVWEMDEFNLTLRVTEPFSEWSSRLKAYWHVVPEVGRFLHDHLRERVSRQAELLERSLPEWYSAYADCVIAGEHFHLRPEDPYQYFMVHAWVRKTDAETLWKYADLPYVNTGDWYYIHKLAETIKAYRGVSWE